MKQHTPATTCEKYHSLTSYSRDGMSGHYLDWKNQPSVYKTYPELTAIPLPREISLPETALSSLLNTTAPRTNTPLSGICIEDLSLLFLLTYSITAKTRHGVHDFFHRNVASAGALYPTELYVAIQGVSGLGDGLYHFSIADHGLSMLREGNLYGTAPGMMHEDGASPTMTFFLSAIFFRSSWKYRDRSYRYHLLDTGHVLENLTLALKNLKYPYRCSFDFDDTHMNRFLGLDDGMEACLAVCTVPGGPGGAVKEVKPEVSELQESIRKRSRVAKNEIQYPAVLEIHSSGNRIVTAENHGTNGPCRQMGITPENWTEITKTESPHEQHSYGETILKRRSKRNFVRKGMDVDRLMALADGICSRVQERSKYSTRDHSTICSGFLCENINGMAAGIYLINPETRCFGTVREGFFIEEMATVCLNQAWLANAAVHFLFFADLKVLENNWGARGYRYAMAQAGRMGERLYLTATAMGLGCCGIGAFYDGDAAKLIGLNAETRLLYLVGIGPVKS
jgi:SagB-type dehydrogenase family enzyme